MAARTDVRVWVWASLCLGLLVGCEPAPPVCFELMLECEGVSAPDFATLHREVLQPRCGTGGSCHVEDDVPAGNLRLDERALAYEQLVDPQRDLIVPARPECSHVVRRVTSRTRFVQMPPAAPLTDEETCAIIAWVGAGAR
ncbi:MAG: hypothetical protein J0L92_26645 [Deltaproteobacteria bacterium]|nr:hypothetical protein [Deltaproteobacteria bacterium]